MKKMYIQPNVEVLSVSSMECICAASGTKSVNVAVTPESFYHTEGDFI